MPIEKPKTLQEEVKAPSQPHLGLLTHEFGSISTVPIPPGSIMMIVMDPKDPKRGLYPIALVKVSPKRLEFKCPCGDGRCNRKVVFNGTWSGFHPPNVDQIRTGR